MRLLVTGTGGLIGGAVVRAAAAASIDVVACARRQPSGLPAGVEAVVADLSDAENAAAVIRQVVPSHVIHAAWETRQPTYWNDPINLSWVLSTAAMAGAFASIGGMRFVQVGSCAEYDWTSPAATTSEMKDGPATRYGKAKVAAFRAIETAGHDAFAAVEARIFWVYGRGENPARFIPLLCRSYAAVTVPDLGSGTQVRDMVHADDAALALLTLLGDDAPTGVVDVGTGKGVALGEVARIIARFAGMSETGIGRRTDRIGDPPSLLAKAMPLRRAGWSPRIPLEDGLKEVFEDWQTEGKAVE